MEPHPTHRIFYVGPGGNDDSDGLTWETRRLTLRAIEEIVHAGDTVRVVGGKEVCRDWAVKTSGGHP